MHRVAALPGPSEAESNVSSRHTESLWQCQNDTVRLPSSHEPLWSRRSMYVSSRTSAAPERARLPCSSILFGFESRSPVPASRFRVRNPRPRDERATAASAEKSPHDLEHNAHDDRNDHHRSDWDQYACVLTLDPEVSGEPPEPVEQTGHVQQSGADQRKTDEDEYDTGGKIHCVMRVESGA